MSSTRDDEGRARLLAFDVLLDHLLHDLKQPLSLIRIVAQDVRLDVRKNRFEVETLPEGMRTVEASVDQLTRQIEQLRAFARAPVAPSDELSADVDAALRAVSERARDELGAQLDVVEGSAFVVLGIDPFSFGMALWELVENAVAAGGAGAVHVAAELRGEYVVLTVRDDGEGIPEEHRAAVFEPFHTTRQSAPGLGLALARKLADRAGGELVLVDDDATGSCFELRLQGRG